MPIGSTEIQKTYLGSDLVYQGGLPSGYTELQYVTTDSNAYIDTGIAGATDLEIYTESRAKEILIPLSVFTTLCPTRLNPRIQAHRLLPGQSCLNHFEA